MTPKLFYRLLALAGMIVFVVAALLLSRGSTGRPPHEKSDDAVLTTLFHEVFALEPSAQRDEMIVDLARAYVCCGNARMGEYLLRRLQRKNVSARSRMETILAGAYVDRGDDDRAGRLFRDVMQKEIRLAQTPYRLEERPNLNILALSWETPLTIHTPEGFLQYAIRRCTDDAQRESVWRVFRRGFDEYRSASIPFHHHHGRYMANGVFSALAPYNTMTMGASDAARKIVWIDRAEAFERDFGVSSGIAPHFAQQKEDLAALLTEIDALTENSETPTAEDVETLAYYLQARYTLGGIRAALDDAGKIKDRGARVHALCRLARELSPRLDKLQPESRRLLETAGKTLDAWNAKEGKTADTVDANTPLGRARLEYLAVKVDYGEYAGPILFDERALRRDVFLKGLTPENLRRILDRAAEQPTLEGRIETLRLFERPEPDR